MDGSFKHLVPLLLFTTLIIIAAGMVLAVGDIHLLLYPWEHTSSFLTISLVLIIVASLTSLLHLGRKERAHRAFIGLANSWLSREAVFAGLTGLFTAVSLGLALIGSAGFGFVVLLSAASLASIILTVSIGMLYNLPVQLSWNGTENSLAPLISSFLLCSYVFVFWAQGLSFSIAFFVIWILDVFLFLLRASTFIRLGKNEHVLLFPSLRPYVFSGLAARFILSVGLMLLIVLDEHALPLYFICATVLLDRFCLYAGTAQLSPKAEIASIKDQRMKAASEL